MQASSGHAEEHVGVKTEVSKLKNVENQGKGSPSARVLSSGATHFCSWNIFLVGAEKTNAFTQDYHKK